MNIKRLMDINAYRGLRHRKNLPVRGAEDAHQREDEEGPEEGRCIEKERGVRMNGTEGMGNGKG